MNKYIYALYYYNLYSKDVNAIGFSSAAESIIYEYEAYCFEAMLVPPIMSFTDWLIEKIKENDK